MENQIDGRGLGDEVPQLKVVTSKFYAFFGSNSRTIYEIKTGFELDRNAPERRSGSFLTRSSADADNRLDAFSGQSRSTNMVPFHM